MAGERKNLEWTDERIGTRDVVVEPCTTNLDPKPFAISSHYNWEKAI